MRLNDIYIARVFVAIFTIYFVSGCVSVQPLIDIPPNINDFRLKPNDNSGDPWSANWLNHTSIKVIDRFNTASYQDVVLKEDIVKRLGQLSSRKYDGKNPMLWMPLNELPVVDNEGLFAAKNRMWRPVRGKYKGETDYEHVLGPRTVLTSREIRSSGYQRVYQLKNRFIGFDMDSNRSTKRVSIKNVGAIFSGELPAIADYLRDFKEYHFTYQVGDEGKISVLNCQYEASVCNLLETIEVSVNDPSLDEVNSIQIRGHFRFDKTYAYYPLMTSYRDYGSYGDLAYYEILAGMSRTYIAMEKLSSAFFKAEYYEKKAREEEFARLQKEKNDKRIAEQKNKQRIRQERDEKYKRAAAERAEYLKSPEGIAERKAYNKRLANDQVYQYASGLVKIMRRSNNPICFGRAQAIENWGSSLNYSSNERLNSVERLLNSTPSNCLQ